MGSATTIRARILVKAHPQPSKTYQETVCVAAVTEDGSRMLRLYPIRYRRLPKEAQFDRFDLVELRVELSKNDHRPESLHVEEDSIRILERGSALRPETKVQLWKQHVAPSLTALKAENRSNRRSLGIIKPDPGSVRFYVKTVDQGDDRDREANASMFEQAALFETELPKLKPSGYLFGYRFTSAGVTHEQIIHDWEVQTAYFYYQRKYGERALDMLKENYQTVIPGQNLHLIQGTMKAHPTNFIIIGLLRSQVSPEQMDAQLSLL